MTDYGISDTGFKRKRLNTLLTELNAAVKNIYGENFNVSEESPGGQINGIISASNADLWELAEESYHAYDPDYASGKTLSSLVQLNGITRLVATKSRVELTITGVANTIIPTGSIVSTSDTNVNFITENEIVIASSGSINVFALAENDGVISASINTVTEIETPVTGWDSVTNATQAQIGTNDETDVELRSRRARSVSRTAQAQIDAIQANVMNVDGVSKAVVLENDTAVANGNGPAHSFHVIVIGGNDDEIAQQIWLSKPAGILAHGTTTVNVYDSQDVIHRVSFSRPVLIDVFVNVVVTKNNDYPEMGDELIKEAIVMYANGDLIHGRGFSLSQDVILTRLYTAINYVNGHEINELKIGISAATLDTENLQIASATISNFTVENITVSSQ